MSATITCHAGLGGRASAGYIKDEVLTSACIIGDRNPGLYVKTGISSDGDLTIDGDGLITGDLTVLGTLTSTISSSISDKHLCLAVPAFPALPSDATADGGGICLLGDTTKTIFWYNAEDAWRFNQNINLDQGISTDHPDDNTIAGSEYRIGGVAVLSATTLGTGVTTSSLREVGSLYKGYIDTTGTVTAITSGNPTIVTTSLPHGMQTGDSVYLSGTNSTPVVDGWWTPVTSISNNQFSISTLTTGNGTLGSYEAGGFYITVGAANIKSGGHIIQNGESSEWKDTSNTSRVVIQGQDGFIQTLSASTNANMLNSKNYNGALASTLGNTIVNTTWEDTTSGTSVKSLQSITLYDGLGTTYTNPFVDTIQQISTESSADIGNNTAVTNAIASSSVSLAEQDGVNWGYVSEADNATRANFGGIGFAGADATTPTSIGVWGAVNTTRTDIGAYAESTWISGTPIHAGLFGYNPITTPGNYAIAADGNVLLDGDVTVTGTLTFPSSGVTSDLIPDTDNAYDLGSPTFQFQDIYYAGSLNGGVIYADGVLPNADATYDLGSGVAQWRDAYFSGTVTAGDITSGAITPDTDCTYDLGTALLRWNDIYYCGTMTSGDMVPQTASTHDIGSAILPYQDVYYDGALSGGTITSETVTPQSDATYDLGSGAAQWRDIYYSGTLYGGAISFGTLALNIQSITASGAAYVVNPDISITEFTVTATSTASMLAASSPGQLKYINIISLTPTTTLAVSINIVNGTTLTFDAAGQSAQLISTSSGNWIVVPGGAVLS